MHHRGGERKSETERVEGKALLTTPNHYQRGSREGRLQPQQSSVPMSSDRPASDTEPEQGGGPATLPSQTTQEAPSLTNHERSVTRTEAQ